MISLKHFSGIKLVEGMNQLILKKSDLPLVVTLLRKFESPLSDVFKVYSLKA